MTIKENITVIWTFWYFIEVPKNIISGWRNFLWFGMNYFSIPLLLKTLFSHWRRYAWSYGRGFDIVRYFNVFFSNLMSRILGALMRIILIFIGIIFEIFIFFLGLIILVGWFLLPLFLIFGTLIGFAILLS